MKRKSLALLLASTIGGIANAHTASAEVPEGVWLVDGEAAVQIFACNSLLCGRIRWLQAPRGSRCSPPLALQSLGALSSDWASVLRSESD